MTDEQKQRLEDIKSLKFSWFEPNKGKPINKFAISTATTLLDSLPEDFEIFPLSDGNIQLECTRDSKYLEIAILENKLEIYWQLLRNGVIICEGSDTVLYISDSIKSKITKFVNFFFNEF